MTRYNARIVEFAKTLKDIKLLLDVSLTKILTRYNA